jgi:Ca2+/Na+ antiporter
MEKPVKGILYLILFVLLFYGIRNVFLGNTIEFIIILGLAGLVGIGFLTWTTAWGERFFFFVSLLSMSYLVLVWYFRDGQLYFILLFLSLLIFLLAFPKRKIEAFDDGEPIINEQPHSVVFEPPEKEGIKTNSVVKEFSPGLYVASRNGAVFHVPKCNWAKKVVEARRVWLESKDVALKKGFKAHNCVNWAL